MLPDFRVRQRDYLLEISRAITQELEMDVVLTRILEISMEMLAGQAGLIALREIQGGWKIPVWRGISSGFLKQLESLLANVPEQEDAGGRYELVEINRLLQAITRSTSFGLLTGVALPLLVQDHVLGVLFIFRNYLGSFSNNDKALLQSFADQAAIAVRNAQLYTQVNQERQRLNALLDSAADGILILRANHIIERANPALAHMLGRAVKELLNRDHDEIIRWASIKEGMNLTNAEAAGWPLTPYATLYVEGDLLRANGLPLPVGITYAPLLSPEGALLNIIATIRDITRFREAEELKGTFISVITHELKTPVALIKGYVSTLRREDATWDRQIIDDSLAVIEDEADRLTELIDNLLDASRLQMGVLALNYSDVNIGSLINRVAERFRTQTQSHRIVVDLPDNFPVVLGDDHRLGQVLSNLLANAIKYSPKGGAITITGKVLSQQVVICVSDQGPGIASNDLPHIFDRFYRSSEAAKTTKGAGLGLYLTRAIVEAHGGRIWVDPAPDGGAKICFSLPRDEK